MTGTVQIIRLAVGQTGTVPIIRITLERGQTWHPRNGKPPRQIQELRAAGLRDQRRPLGSKLVCWAWLGRWGTCSTGAFRRWIKLNEARCHDI